MQDDVSKGIAQQTVVVILAAGRGTRMGRADMAKVCFEIDGVPAINRLIETFRRNRFEKLVIVVGSLAGQVVETVGSEYPEVLFVSQMPQLGTGHAGKIVADALQRMGHRGPVLLSLGDKYIDPAAVEKLVEGYIRQQADLALLTVPRTRSTELSSGRVIINEAGQAVDIIERIDLARQAIADELRRLISTGKRPNAEQIAKLTEKYIENPKKRAKAVPELLELCKRNGDVDRGKLEATLATAPYNLVIDDQPRNAAEIENSCKQFNPSLYMFDAEAFYQGVAMIDNNNAQHEYYLTDIVRHLAGVQNEDGSSRFRVRTVPIKKPELIQGFNSPEELLDIQDYLRRSKKSDTSSLDMGGVKPNLTQRHYTTVQKWITRFESCPPPLKRWLKGVYGDHPKLHAEKCK